MNRQIFEYHSVIGYRYIPNLQVRIPHESGGYLVKTNNLGFRSDFPFEEKKHKDIKRILLFGDSYSAADGVSNKARYSDVLMKLIPGIEIYNFAMPGTGTDQQYLIYKEFAKNIEHDLVMIVVLVENIRRIVSAYRYYLNEDQQKVIYQKPYFFLHNNELQLQNVPVNPKQLALADLSVEERDTIDEGGRFPQIRKVINKAGLKELVQKVTRYQPLPEYKKNGEEWNLMKKILVDWHDEVDKPMLLVHLPLHQYVEQESDYTHIAQRFDELSDLENIKVLNPLNTLIRYPIEQRRKFRFEHDTHPTAAGHAAYADAFKPAIQEILHM